MMLYVLFAIFDPNRDQIFYQNLLSTLTERFRKHWSLARKSFISILTSVCLDQSRERNYMEGRVDNILK